MSSGAIPTRATRTGKRWAIDLIAACALLAMATASKALYRACRAASSGLWPGVWRASSRFTHSGTLRLWHRAEQCCSKPSAAACKPWCTWMACTCPGHLRAQASNRAVESAPPLSPTAIGNAGEKSAMATSNETVMAYPRPPATTRQPHQCKGPLRGHGTGARRRRQPSSPGNQRLSALVSVKRP